MKAVEWNTSESRAALVTFLRDEILESPLVEVDSAVHMGLGSMERFSRCLSWLLVFETIVSVLGEKFRVFQVRFSDPGFTAVDCAFLRERGHHVLPYFVKDTYPRWPVDPKMVKLMTENTFLFAPFLEECILVEVIGTARPRLFFGEDFLGDLGPDFLGLNCSVYVSHSYYC